jgi:hypothetical protein
MMNQIGDTYSSAVQSSGAARFPNHRGRTQ